MNISQAMTPRKRLFDEVELSLLMETWQHAEGCEQTVERHGLINDFVNAAISRNVHEALDEISAIDIQGDPNDAIRLIEEIKSRYPAKKEKI